MPSYRKLGKLPEKRHMQLEHSGESYLGEGLYYEHVITTQGFDRSYSIMYHSRPPTRVTKTESVGEVNLKAVANQELRHHHIKTQEMPRVGDPITSRCLLYTSPSPRDQRGSRMPSSA